MRMESGMGQDPIGPKGLKGRLELMECPDFDGRREVEGCMMDGEK